MLVLSWIFLNQIQRGRGKITMKYSTIHHIFSKIVRILIFFNKVLLCRTVK